MAALLDVPRRPAEATDQEVAQPFFGTSQLVGGIHRSENVIVRHLRIKRAHESGEAVLANARIDLILGQGHNMQYVG